MNQLLDSEMAKTKPAEESNSKRLPTIELYSTKVYEKLKKIASQNDSNLRKYTNEILTMHVEKEEFLEKHMSNMKKIGFEDGIFYIRDNNLHKSTQIGLLDGTIHCDLCNNTKNQACVHIIYAMMLPEVGRLGPIRS